MKITLQVLLIFLLFGCSNTGTEQSAGQFKKPLEAESRADTLQAKNERKSDAPGSQKSDTTTHKKEKPKAATAEKPTKAGPEEEPIPSRIIQFPSDDHYNNADQPLLYDLELHEKVLRKHPDTLKTIVRQAYLSFKDWYPVSVSDNFEEGISTEHIHWPKLKFKLRIYEDENAREPYRTEIITAERKRDGKVVVE